MKEINGQLSLPQADQLPAQQDDLAKITSNEDSSITVDLTLDLGSAGRDRVIRRGVKLGSSNFDSTVSDFTAEVDFEIGPDVSSEYTFAAIMRITSSQMKHCVSTLGASEYAAAARIALPDMLACIDFMQHG